jgi:hypothetical protein
VGKGPDSGKSRHGAPTRNFQITASTGAAARWMRSCPACRPRASTLISSETRAHPVWDESGCALDSQIVAFPFGKPVSTFPGNALGDPEPGASQRRDGRPARCLFPREQRAISTYEILLLTKGHAVARSKGRICHGRHRLARAPTLRDPERTIWPADRTSFTTKSATVAAR